MNSPAAPALTPANLCELVERLWQRRRRRRAARRRPPISLPDRAPTWPKTQAEFEEFWADARPQQTYFDPSRLAFYREFLEFLPARPCRLLDLGCGNGHFLRLVADRWRAAGPSLLAGVDYAARAVEAAARLVPEAVFRTGQMQATGFPGGSFDAVVAMEVFEHLARPRAALREAWRLVAPGGTLLITIPDGRQDWWLGHTNFWSAQAFRRFLSPLPVRSTRRLSQGRVLVFELVKPAQGPQGSLTTRFRQRAATAVHEALRRRGYDLVRLRPRPTYAEELSRYASQVSMADLGVKPGSVVLDVGTGHYPFPHATILSELHLGETRHRTEPLVRDGRPFLVLDIHRMPFRSQSVDFVYCSHVLEHVRDPGRACAELQRVGHEGYIETPTFGKDVLFAWAPGMHRWHVVAIGDRLVFFEYNERQLQGVRSTAWWDTIFGDTYHPLQEVFHANQDLFNVAFRWRGPFAWTVYHLDGRVEASDASRDPGRP